ncbi:hypothetical protein ACFVHQ_15395 [Actinomycetes bacterium NPDC127524]
MKLLVRKSKKAFVISAIAACSLFAGSMGAGAEGSTAASKTGQAQLYASSVKAAATVSKKGVMSFPKRFNKKNVINELKPEAVNLIKTYGSTLQTGSTRNFNAYVDKHMMNSTSKIIVGGRESTKKSYKIRVSTTKKYNSKEKVSSFSKGLKKATASKLKIEQKYIKDYSAQITYEYKPAGSYISAKVAFTFILQSNGKYIISAINFY